MELNVSVTISYRIIIALLLGWALSPSQFDILMALVRQKAIAQGKIKCTHPYTITAGEWGCVVEGEEGRGGGWGMVKGMRVGEWRVGHGRGEEGR